MKYLRLLTHLDEGIDRNKGCLDCFSKQEDPKLRYARVYLGLSQTLWFSPSTQLVLFPQRAVRSIKLSNSFQSEPFPPRALGVISPSLGSLSPGLLKALDPLDKFVDEMDTNGEDLNFEGVDSENDLELLESYSKDVSFLN
ncbi:hypothetical protein NPIL_220781 [Nephila pilipes]|uniref:Uncharacterized protein n=1 Tax=Nephila pilipes TaxID=299642 RepID=A0A8X6NI52_NEPPI|nr:hypothetical protein NPIL_220781 [Nephila pilipes]